MRLTSHVGLALILVAAGGCSQVTVVEPTAGAAGTQAPNISTPSNTANAIDSVPVGGLAHTDLVSPVLEWQGGGMSSDELFNTKARAVASCMQQRGWTYEPSLQQATIPQPRTIGELREYRSTYGYGMFTTPEFEGTANPKEAADRNADYLASLGIDQQEGYKEDLNGNISGEGQNPVDGSCEALAAETIGIPLEDQAVMAELSRMYQAAFQSPEFLSALDAWRACLADRGYEIDRDEDPVLLLHKRAAAGVEPQELADLEIAVAVADFECSFTTKLPVRHRLEIEIVRKLVEKYPEWGS